jgi:hypothetical protein
MYKRERDRQITDLIKEDFDELAPTTEEITMVENELRNDPEKAVAELCLTNGSRTTVNMLYISSAVGAIRKRKHGD